MLNHVYWGCWIVGAVLILLSRSGVVSSNIGWAGFWVACVAALLSRLPRRLQTPQPADWAHLTSAMLESKDHGYERAMACLHAGGSVVCEGGLSFAVESGDVLELVTCASCSLDEMDDARALDDAGRAAAVFESIARSSPEVAATASGRRLRVSLVSELSPDGVEICGVADHRVEWNTDVKPAVR
jgi:hypothetical protein